MFPPFPFKIATPLAAIAVPFVLQT